MSATYPSGGTTLLPRTGSGPAGTVPVVGRLETCHEPEELENVAGNQRLAADLLSLLSHDEIFEPSINLEPQGSRHPLSIFFLVLFESP